MFRLITKAGMLTVLAISANIAPVFAQNFALGTPPFENPQPAVVVDSGGRAVGPYFPVPSPVNATTPQDYALVKVPSAPGSTSNLFSFCRCCKAVLGRSLSVLSTQQRIAVARLFWDRSFGYPGSSDLQFLRSRRGSSLLSKTGPWRKT